MQWCFSRSNTFIILFFFLITFVSVQTTEIVLQRVHHQLLHIVVQRLSVVRAQHGIHSRGTNRVDFRLDDVQIQILQHANNLRQQPRSVRSFNQQLGLGPVGDGGHRDSRRHNLSLLLRRSHVFGFRIVCHFVRLWVSRRLLHKLLRFRVIIAHSRQHRLSQILQSRRRRYLLRTLVVRHVEAVLVAFRNFRSGNIQTQISNRLAGIRELPEFVSKLNLEDSRQRVRQVIDDNFRDDFLRFVRRRSARDDNARSAGRFRRRCRSVCYYCFCRLKKKTMMMSVWAVFFFLLLQLLGPSFFCLISKKEAPLSLSRAFDTSKKSNIFRREREQFFFSTRKRHETRPFSLSLSLVPPLWRSHSHTIDIDYSIGRVTTQCEDLSRCSSEDDDHHHRDRQRRERVRERGKEERKKKHSEATRETKGSKNSYESDTFSSLSWNFSKRLNENVPRA